jgi:hypothetical protein
MSDFWIAMAPWLIMAVLLPVGILLSLKLMPSDEWSQRVIRDWADSEGLRVVAIDEVRLLGGLYFPGSYRVFQARLLDKKGLKRECKAVVGHLLLGQTYRNIAITWIKAR